MDFIPLPVGVTSHELVPDLGGPDYDNEGFLGYGQRQGWNVDALRQGDLAVARNDWHEYIQGALQLFPRHDFLACDNGGTQTVVGSFLQTWILFGILQEALNRPVFRHEVSHVVEPLDSPQIIRSINLRPLFREFISKAKGLKTNTLQSSHLFRCLRIAASVLSDLDRFLSLGFPLMPLIVHQALSVLVETFHDYTRLFCPRQIRDTEDYFLVHNNVARKSLSQRGWCPNLIERISAGFHHTGLYYASILPVFDTGGPHDACNDLVCVASNIDNAAYNVQHVPEECSCQDTSCNHKTTACSCQLITVPESIIQSTFEDEGFPLINLEEDHIEIIKYSPGVRYIALSHVWSDGRGNPFANALPICQIQSIHRYVTAFYPHQVPRFWIDTLCVPIREPLRNTAIVRMAKVYSSASSVLVLSADLSSAPDPHTTDELLIRLYCSTWNTRLWTRQEATLAKDMGFQFLDRAVRYSELVAARNLAVTRLTTADKSGLIAILSESWLVGLFNLRSRSKAEPLTLEDFWHGLRYRSTSRPTDVAISGSILMGGDLSRVLEAPPEMKMQAFWSGQKRVSSGILWVSGPRLKTDGFSWAPSNLLDPVTTMVGPRSGPIAEQTSTGLVVDGIEAILLENFKGLVDDLDTFWFSVSGSPHRYFICKEWRPKNMEIQASEIRDGQFVLLFPRLPRYDGEDAALIILKYPMGTIECTENAERPVSAHYYEKLWIFKEDVVIAQHRLKIFKNSHPELRYFLDQKESSKIPELRLISPLRRWCIC